MAAAFSSLRRFWRDQRGITGLETAIVLIAFVVVSSVFAFSVLTTGLYSSDSAKETISAGLEGKRSTLELKGSVILTSSTTGVSGVVSEISFQVGVAAAGDAVDLTPGNTIIRYTDKNQVKNFASPAAFSSANISSFGDGDKLLEPGEIFELKLLNLNTAFTTNLAPSTTFTIEVVTPVGGVLFISRTTPSSLETTNVLE